MQNPFTSSVFISNIIISACIGLSYLYLDDDFELLRTGQNIGLGITLLTLTVVAAPFALIKAKDLAARGHSKITQGEIFLITMLYFAALFVTTFIAYMACCFIEGDSHLSDDMLILFCAAGGVAVLLFLWECWTLFLTFPKKPPAKTLVAISNFIVPLYAGLAIAVLWEGAFDQAWEANPIDSRKVILSIIMAFVLILPFQRLFWYESFINSQSRKENLMAIASIFISVAIAVIGVL